jgi:hypothetical protein
MRRATPLFLFFLVGCLLFAGCSTKETLPLEEKQSLDRAINYIEQFKASHFRLPDRSDLWAWKSTNNLIGINDYWIAENGKTNEYVIHIWLGEEAVNYYSKDKSLVRFTPRHN